MGFVMVQLSSPVEVKPGVLYMSICLFGCQYTSKHDCSYCIHKKHKTYEDSINYKTIWLFFKCFLLFQISDDQTVSVICKIQ